MKAFIKLFLCGLIILFSFNHSYAQDLYFLVVDKSESIKTIGLEKSITKAVKDFINTLSEDVELRVVFFSSTADISKKWPSLTFDAKQDFFEYFNEKFKPRGKTRLYDTVVEVVEEVYSVSRDYDEIKIMILSDGENTVDSKYKGWRDIDILAKNLKQDNNNAFVFWYTLGFEPTSIPKEISVIKVKNPHQQIKIEPPPVAGFDAYPTRIEAGQSVKFFVQPSSGIISDVSLDFGDGSSSSQLTADHTYDALGTYSVSLWVKGPGGEDEIKKINFIEVVPTVPVKAGFSWSPSNPREGDVIQLVDRSEGSPKTYAWELDLYGSSSDTSPAIKAEKSGEIKITLSVKRGSQSDSVEKQIIIKPLPPNPDFSQSAKEIFSGDKLELTAVEKKSSVKHEWRINTQNIPGSQYAEWVADETGMIGIYHRVSGPGGFNVEKSSVFVKGVGNVMFSVSPKSGTFPLEVKFKDESEISGVYKWDFGDSDFSSEKNPKHTYANAGEFKTVLTITTAAGDKISSPEPVILSVKSPAPWWLKWAICGAAFFISALLILLYFQDGPVSGSLQWKYKGSEGIEELAGKSFSLNEMNITGWEPNQKYFIKNKRKREIQLLSDGIEIKKLGRKTEFKLEGVSFTYFNQLINE